MEARAKAIFQTLEAQLDTVILFDEIDSFLLDRDTERYNNQDSLFQFLTPGMLTKINNLRKRERSIFIIATNYANRIDPAIKRRGRIDQRYLLSLPSAEKRLEIIMDRRKGKSVAPKYANDIKKRTLFFGYPDLAGLVKEAKFSGNDDKTIQELLSSGGYSPATTIDTYFARHKEENFPFEELVDLETLKKEVDENFNLDGLVGDKIPGLLDAFNSWREANGSPKVELERMSNDEAK